MPLSAALPRISTNVRFTAARLLAPDYAGAWAERLFLTPPRPRDGALTALDLIDARAGSIENRGRFIATWRWGSRDAPAVLLAHGWGGHAAQMRAFVFPLLLAGYRVIAWDQPAHGISDGRLTGLPDFADVLTQIAWEHGEVHGLIAHSLGASAATFALARGLAIPRVVLIGASMDVDAYSRRFARWHRIPEAMRRAMRSAIEERFGVRWSELDMAKLAPRLRANALVIHDSDDRVVPWIKGAAFARAWPGARLQLTSGLGHSRILGDDEVTATAARFISGASEVASPASPELPAPAPLY